MPQTWSPDRYAHHAAFVPALGATILEWLAPQPGERVLDLGCGDGALTQTIASRGAEVIAVDASPEMAAAARSRGIDAHVMRAEALTFRDEFDAVFSNAVLHWIHDPDAAIAAIARALRPGGRFVAEFGGHGCVAAIVVATRAVLSKYGVQVDRPWYFPTPDEYSARLVAHGFSVDRIELVPRPTPLPTGLRGWLGTFAGFLLDRLPPAERTAAESAIEDLLRPTLMDSQGRWTADYVRLRVAATISKS